MLGRENPLNAIGKGNRESSEGGYNSELGFVVYIDYVLGLPGRVRQLQIVYAFYEGPEAQTPIRSLPLAPTEAAGQTSQRAVLAVSRQFKKVHPSTGLKLVFEAQEVKTEDLGRGPRTVPIGWCALWLFNHDRALLNGLWKLPLYHPPVRLDMDPDSLNLLAPIPFVELYVRLVDAADMDIHSKFVVSPEATRTFYRPLQGRSAAQPGPPPAHTHPSPLHHPLASTRLTPGMDHNHQPVAVSDAEAQGPQAMAPKRTTQNRLEEAMPLDQVQDEPETEYVEVQLQVWETAGMFHSHGHVPDPGNLFVRVSLADMLQGKQIPVAIVAHPDIHVSSPGLRLLKPRSRGDDEHAADGGADDDGADEYIFMQAESSWCTSSREDESDRRHPLQWNEGCNLAKVPVRATTALIVEVFQEGPASLAWTQGELRENAQSDDVLVGWATLTLFSMGDGGGGEEDAEEEERAGEQEEDGKDPGSHLERLLQRKQRQNQQRHKRGALSGTVLNNGVHNLQLAAPPVDGSQAYELILVEQQKMGKRFGVEGMISHQAGYSAILNPPVPFLSIKVEPIDEPPLPLEKLRARESQINMLLGLKRKAQAVGDLGASVWTARDSVPWLPVGLPPISRRLFAQGDGFDFYVDGARYLPDNVSLTSIEAFGIDRDKKILYGKLKRDVDPRSRSVRSPVYNARKEFRWDSQKGWSPTMTIVIEITGLERTTPKPDFETAIVGFALINVFVDPETGEQPLHASIPEYVLNEGAFQISICRASIPRDKPLDVWSFADKLRRNCSTLLVRLVQAPRSADGLEVLSAKTAVGSQENLERLGLLVQPEPYLKGGYASLGYSDPRPIEDEIYPLRMQNEDKTRMTVEQALLEAGEQQLTLQQQQALKDYYPYDPSSFSEELKVLASRVKTVLQTCKPLDAMRFINANYCIAHSLKTGFYMSVDGVNNLDRDFVYSGIYAMTSPFPPGSYYNSGGSLTNELQVVQNISYDSETTCPRWTDGFQKYSFDFQPRKANPYLVMILDVRAFVTALHQRGVIGSQIKPLAAPTVKQLGFALLPVFGQMGNYTISGNYQLPLFAMGPDPELNKKAHANRYKDINTFQDWLKTPEGPPGWLLERISLSATNPGYPYEALREAFQDGDVHFVKGASVLVRVVDGSRRGEFATKWDVSGGKPDKINFQHIPPNRETEYFVMEKHRTIRGALGKELRSEESHRAEMYMKFINFLRLEKKIEALEAEEERAHSGGAPPASAPLSRAPSSASLRAPPSAHRR